MVTNDATILRVKHEVLYEVAKMAFEGTLEEQRGTSFQIDPRTTSAIPSSTQKT